MLTELSKVVQGRVRTWDVFEKKRWENPSPWKHNLLMVSWGFIAAKAIGQKDNTYGFGGMYLEFENNPPTITAPTYDAYDGIDYYTGLSGDRDFLRVELVGTPQLDIRSGDENYFTEGVDGNEVSVFALSTGDEGVAQDLAFSDGTSTVFGVGLVAQPVPSNQSQDVLFARTYFSAAQQKQKVAGADIGIQWDIAFKL